MTKEQLAKQIDEILFLKAKEKFASPQWLIHESNLREKMNEYYKLTKTKNPNAIALGSIKSKKKAKSSRKNGKKGGRPRKLLPTLMKRELASREGEGDN